jgi:3-hydroxyisobutyrate dehydrogenase-like beta-hydroxyacid dehydrogenase
MSMPPDQKQPVGVVGLGLLGTALCERLLEAGYTAIVWNRTREKASPLLARGALWSDNPLAECDRAVVCLYTTAVVEQVLRELDPELRPGQILIDATTGDPQETAALGARLAERGVQYLESPIAASSEQTRRGEAVAIVAGPRVAFDACRALFDAIARQAFYVGDWGSAAKIKLVNNLVLGLNRVALAEGLVFARAIGLDPAEALAVLKQGSAHSVVMDTKGRKMIDGDFAVEAKLSQHAKDVRIILEEAGRVGRKLPLTELHLQLLRDAESAGLGALDNSAIIQTIAANVARNATHI